MDYYVYPALPIKADVCGRSCSDDFGHRLIYYIFRYNLRHRLPDIVRFRAKTLCDYCPMMAVSAHAAYVGLIHH